MGSKGLTSSDCKKPQVSLILFFRLIVGRRGICFGSLSSRNSFNINPLFFSEKRSYYVFDRYGNFGTNRLDRNCLIQCQFNTI